MFHLFYIILKTTKTQNFISFWNKFVNKTIKYAEGKYEFAKSNYRTGTLN